MIDERLYRATLKRLAALELSHAELLKGHYALVQLVCTFLNGDSKINPETLAKLRSHHEKSMQDAEKLATQARQALRDLES